MTTNKKRLTIGIIGGSGLDDPHILKNSRKKKIKTPYGSPASAIVFGEIKNNKIAILARHGFNHSLPPTHVPYRANIWALKEAGCDLILSTTACGSLREEFKPGDLVFVDQFIDFTKHRPLTFFEDKVIHTPMAFPFDQKLREKLVRSARKLHLRFHSRGTIITIEGPRFSTKAESNMFRLWGADLINMSTVPEVVLANEVKIPYQTIAMVTDYDCWKESEEAVTFDLVIKRMKENVDKVKKLLVEVIAAFC